MKAVWNSPPARFVREVAALYFSKNVSRAAAELAYFLILTFFPILICVNAFVGMLHLELGPLPDVAGPLLPRGSLALLAEYVAYITGNQSAALLAGGVVMTLFSASAALRALMNVMGDIYNRKSYIGVRQIIASVLFSLLLLVSIYLSLAVLITGGWFFRLLEGLIGVSLPVDDWQWMRFLLLFCFMLLFILLVYRLSAPRGTPRPPVLTGGLLAALALVAASALFSWFIGLSSRYSLVYGSLASVIILLVWLYLCGNILIVGNLINAVWYAHKKQAQEEWAGG